MRYDRRPGDDDGKGHVWKSQRRHKHDCLVESRWVWWKFSTSAYPNVGETTIRRGLMFKNHWFKRQRYFGGRKRVDPLGQVGFVLALIGGIVIVVLSLAALLNFPVYLPIQSPLAGFFGIGLITLILGVVAVFGSRRVNQVLWAVVLMIVGFLGGGIGGLLTLLGGLVGLLSRYV